MTKEGILPGIEVSVDEGERVRLAFAETGAVFHFTPAQARALASQLIQTVYQAEVRHSLQRNRGTGLTPAVKRVVEAHFGSAKIAPAGE